MNMSLQVSRMRVSGVLALGMLAAVAAEVEIKDGSQDIALPSAWKAGTLPSSNANVRFPSVDNVSYTYTASADVMFGPFTIGKGAKVFDFTGTPGRRVTITDGLDKNGQKYGVNIYAQSGNVTFKGGIWDLGGFIFSNGYASGNTKSMMLLTDGVVVTNVSNFYWGDRGGSGGGNGKLTISGDAKVYTKGDFINYATGKLNNLELSGGAQVFVGGVFSTDYSGVPTVATGRNTTLITGEGTLLSVKYQGDPCGLIRMGTSYVGVDHPSNTVTVADGAKWSCSTPIWIGANGTQGNGSGLSVGNKLIVDHATLESGTVYVGRLTEGNQLIIRNGSSAVINYLGVGGQNAATTAVAHGNKIEIDASSVYVSNSFNIGWPGYDNRVEIRNGATLSATSLDMGLNNASAIHNTLLVNDSSVTLRNGSGVFIGNQAGGQTMVVSNSAFRSQDFVVGKVAGATGNVVRFVDCGNRIDLWSSKTNANNTLDFFGYSNDNVFELDNTEVDVGKVYLRIGFRSTNNVLRLKNGAKLRAKVNTPSFGNGGINPGIRLELLDESELDVIRFRMMSVDGTMVVSNSCMSLTDVGNGFCVGYREGSQTFDATNNVVVLQGDHPKIGAGATKVNVSFLRQATLHVDVPPKGYAPGYALVEAAQFKLDETSRVTVSMDDYYAREGGRILLAETTDGVSCDAAALAASNALLPTGCALTVSDDRMRLYLVVPSRKGTTLLIR